MRSRPKSTRLLHEPILEEEDRRQHADARRSENADVEPAGRARSAARAASRRAVGRPAFAAARGARGRGLRRSRPVRPPLLVLEVFRRAADSAESKLRKAFSQRADRRAARGARAARAASGRSSPSGGMRNRPISLNAGAPAAASSPSRVWFLSWKRIALVALDELDAVEDAAAHIARALEGVAAARRDHDDRLLPGLQALHQLRRRRPRRAGCGRSSASLASAT